MLCPRLSHCIPEELCGRLWRYALRKSVSRAWSKQGIATDIVIVPNPTEIVDLYPAIVSMNSLISPLLNSILVQSRKPVLDFLLKTSIDCSNSRHTWLHRSIGPWRSANIDASALVTCVNEFRILVRSSSSS